MVTGGKGDIFRAGILDSAHPFCRIEVGGIESSGSLGIFFGADIVVVELPFSLSEHTGYAPVKKNAESIVGKLLPSLEIFSGRDICGCFFRKSA